MIIACPACATRYVVPDSAIGVEGRTVRCSKCRHSWFQEGPQVEVSTAASAPQPAPAPAPPPPPPPQPAAPPVAEPSPAPPPPEPEAEPAGSARPGFAEQILPEGNETQNVAEPPQPEPRVAPPPSPKPEEALPEPVAEEALGELPEDEAEPPEGFAVEPPPVAEADEAAPAEDEEYSQFGYEPPFRPRRNLLRLWTIAAAVFALFALGTVFAVSYWGLPDWVPVSKPTFGLGQQDLVLDFPQDKQDRRQLPNGTEFFGASGSVTNVGSQTRSVPPILIVLRDAKNRIVYTWEVTPSKRTLAPGESVSINEAVTDVPKSAKFAEFGWKPG